MNILDFLKGRFNDLQNNISPKVKQVEDFLNDNYLNASSKIRSSGMFSLDDNEKKNYIESLTNFAKHKLDYFNPESNQGNNFWSTPTAQKLANVQKVTGVSMPSGVDEWNSRLEEAMGITPESKARQDKIRKYGFGSLTKEEKKKESELALNQAMMIGSTAPEGTDLKSLANMAIDKAKSQEGAIDRLSYVVDKALEGKGQSVLQKAKSLRATLANKLFEISGSKVAGNYNADYEFIQKARSNPQTTKLIDNLEAQIIRLDDSIKSLSQKSLEGVSKDKTPLTGLMSESPAMTKFRRSGNLTVDEVYKNKDYAVQQFQKHLDGANLTVKQKANVFDYLSTPEYVLKKMGLSKELDGLRTAQDNYTTHLKSELNKINDWYKQVPDKRSSKSIFQYLDGRLPQSKLTGDELKVAGEIKDHLKSWADKLGLPKDNRVSDYITHIFEKGEVQKEFDPELAKIINDKIAGSVYNPFLQKRTDAPKYVEDTWRALEAYVKRGTRDYNMSPALKTLKESTKNFEPYSLKYIKRFTDRINLRPTELDEGIDNFIKASPIGYKFTQRPTAYLTKKFRGVVYKGALGLNVGSALKNLTQGVNTYAKLGEKYTILGYSDLIKNMAKNNLDELYRYNILDDSIMADREIHAVKKALQKVDEGLFAMFDTAEKINRGSAYFGAKRRALAEGLSEAKAIEYGKKIVRETQFSFNNVETPLALSGDIAKTIGQFQSYGLKQAEFLKNMIKDKNFLGLLRYTMGSVLITSSIGKAFGLNLSNFVPFNEGRFSSPATELISGTAKSLSTNDQTRQEGHQSLKKLIPLAVPAGVQIKKTVQGAIDNARGYSASPSGLAKFPVGGTPSRLIQLLLLGSSATKQAQEYYKNHESVLGKNQTKELSRIKSPQARERYYYQIIKEREAKRQ